MASTDTDKTDSIWSQAWHDGLACGLTDAQASRFADDKVAAYLKATRDRRLAQKGRFLRRA